MKYSRPAIERGVLYLHKLIESGKANQDARLPGIHTLAVSAGISYQSMWSALQIVRGEKLVEGYKGRRFRIKGVMTKENAGITSKKQQHLENVRNELIKDILGGYFVIGGELPPRKEMTNRYRCSIASLNNALDELTAERILRKNRCHFRIATLPRQSPVLRLVVLWFSDVPGEFTSTSPQAMDFWSTLDRECTVRNITIDIMTILYNDIKIKKPVIETPLPSDPNIIGYLVFSIPFRELLRDFLKAISIVKKPVVIFDNHGQCDDLYRQFSSSMLKVFQVGIGEHHGVTVGRYLITQKHNRVVYLCTRKEPWVEDRYSGIKKAYASIGKKDAVLQKYIQLESVPETQIDSMTLRDLINCRSRLFIKWPASTNQAAIDGIAIDYYINSLLAIENAMRPLIHYLKDLLNGSGVTAIVCENDSLALKVYDCLNFLNVKIPDEMTVMGFDNHFYALTHSLTTYDFNIPVAVRSALYCCLFPNKFSNKQKIIETVAGEVISRKTVTERHP